MQPTRDVLDAAPTGSELAGWFCWQSSDGGATVKLSEEVAGQLKQEVLTGFRALPRRGAEVGGLLLGRIESSKPLVVCIEGCEPAPCEHRFGPSFILSHADRTRLEARIAKFGGEGQTIVGYYRSCTGREIGLDIADEEIIPTYFSAPENVFLLIKPVSLQELVAAFLFWENGQLPAEPRDNPFPLRTSAPVTPVGDSAEPEAKPVERPALPAAVAGEAPVVECKEIPTRQSDPMALTETPAPRAWTPRRFEVPEVAEPQPPVRAARQTAEREQRQEDRTRWPWLVFGVLLVISAVLGYEWWNSTRGSARARLGLDVEQTTDGLAVSWDSDSPAVRNAKRGILSITDGASQNDIELNGPAVRRGKFAYHSSAKNVLIRFEVEGEGLNHAAETLRVVMPPPAQVSSPPPPLPAAAAPMPEVEPKPAEPKATSGLASASGNPEATIAIPAKVIREVRPGVPEGIRARIEGRIVVPVSVEVNAAGRVVRAVAQRDGDGLYRYLAGRAAEAAKLWRFQPARTKDGAAVSSNTTVSIVF